jgi:hypothetical protein
MPIDVASSIKFTATDTEPTSDKGRIYYDDSESSVKHYDGNNWVPLVTSVTPATNTYSAGQFDSSNDYINTNHHFEEVFGNASGFAVQMWFKFDDGNPVDEDATNFFMGTRNADQANQFWLKNQTNGGLLCEYRCDGNEVNMGSPAVLGDGVTGWHHFFIGYKQTTGGVMYLDGVKIQSATSMGSMTMSDYENDQNFYIMAHNNEGSLYRPTGGYCTEVAIWSGVLPDASAISSLYNGGVPVDVRYAGGQYTGTYSAALYAYWQMNENTGTSLTDSSDNSYTATLTNGVGFDSERPS